ncbi:MAG TPA: Holliday junction branch migration protein RuvA [Verrucomicrobiae bacterium]|nr:Holliday junction branch migration protein RuvA [Verrucomicrobiae bacterium]
MIATLTGIVSEKLGELVVLDVQGIGYGLLVPVEDYGKLASGDKTKFYVHEHIRENSHDLFGFTQLDTKRLFELLLEVNGVGPKMALNVLSIGSAEDVRQAIAAGDTKFIQAANGVGKRVAERVVVDLKDKVGLTSTADPSALFASNTIQDEATQALVALGYTVQDAQVALAKVDASLGIEGRIKQALKAAI